MYMIKKHHSRKLVPKNLRGKYATYDQARNAVRKHLRSVEKRTKAVRHWLDILNRTVTISNYGYTLERT